MSLLMRYTRVKNTQPCQESTDTQEHQLNNRNWLDDQIQKLKEAGCRTVFNERISSGRVHGQTSITVVLTVEEGTHYA